jgi:hypothetical protein
MGNIKKIALAHSEWLTFELERVEKLLDPPAVRLRLKHLTGLDSYGAGVQGNAFSQAMTELIADCVVEWDLCEDGKPIPCTPEKKREMWDWLRAVLGSKVKGTKDRLLGIAILDYAGNLENFIRP